jgi:hypothetical protein
VTELLKNQCPKGWEQVTSGVVQLGDMVWAPLSETFVEVTEGVLNDLAFLDARQVEECICVIRKA